MSTNKIQNRLKIIDDIKQEKKKLRALYKEKLEERESYQEIQEEKKRVRQQAREHKLKVKSDPELGEYELQLKELRQDMRENKQILAQELADYYKETGSLEIKDDDGKKKKIVFSARLVND